MNRKEIPDREVTRRHEKIENELSITDLSLRKPNSKESRPAVRSTES